MGESNTRLARNGAVQHAREAIESGEMAEKNYHIKEALQLLDVGVDSDADR